MVCDSRQRRDMTPVPSLLEAARTSPSIVVHSPADVYVDEEVNDHNSRADDVPGNPAQRHTPPAPVGPEITVVAEVLVAWSVDEGQRCSHHGK